MKTYITTVNTKDDEGSFRWEFRFTAPNMEAAERSAGRRCEELIDEIEWK